MLQRAVSYLYKAQGPPVYRQQRKLHEIMNLILMSAI